MNDLLDQLRGMPAPAIAVLGAVAAFLLVLAVGVQRSAYLLRRDLHSAEEELVDPVTGLLPRSAIPVRLGAELAWASTSRTEIGVAALRIRGSRFTHATSVLRAAMREEEQAFLLGDQRVAVELWGAGALESAAAVRRLGAALARAGHPVVDAGVALAPRDGRDVEQLVASALRDLRPADDPTPPGHDLGPDGRARGPLAHTLAILARVLPWFVASALLLLLAWRLVPASINPALDGGARSARDLVVALVSAIGVPIGAALLVLAAWNHGGGTVPRSHPLVRARWRTAAVVAVVVGAPLTAGVFAPAWPDGSGIALGATFALLALTVASLAFARQLVHAPDLALAWLLAAGVALTWACVDGVELPLLANAGRLLCAASLGAILARLVERASWLVGLAFVAGAIDAWSVWSDAGISKRLLDSKSGGGSHAIDLVGFTGPVVHGHALFTLGTTDLVFAALFLAWSHAWRVDMRITIAVLLASIWGAVAWATAADVDVPVLPVMCGGMVLLLAGRSYGLRRRVRRWNEPAPDAPAT
ncbi:MAG: hypothetical protein H7287_13855 [Thermoleophilia bacterium]|nr:hypothetical protein [Thermoleophilia bacterium]